MIGRDIGNYRITALIGEGGMGLVYLAEHQSIDRKVAVKVLRNDLPANADLVTRFVNEARVTATIRHPNVIEVLDTGRLVPEGVPYIVMELLEGETLAARLARVGRVEIADATLWAYEVAAALGVAHAKEIIHRDLKPANLYLVSDDRQPDREKIKVLDFGIAKLRGGLAGASSHTQTGSLLGTPLYMSPEQCRGAKEIDTRSDIYSLGIILYEMVCGAPPFVSTGFGELISMHLNTVPPAPRSHNPAVSEALEAAILRALAKRPEDRFATVGELQAALGFTPSRTAQGSAVMPVVTPARGLPSAGPMVPPAATPSGGVVGTGGAGPPAGAPRTPYPTPPSGATRMASASILWTPAPGTTPAGRTGQEVRDGARGRRRRLPLLIGGAVLAAAAVLVLMGGQLGPRLHCAMGKSCTELGDCYDAGHCGIARDREHACEIYDKDCTAGQMSSCVRFGHCYEAHSGGIQSSWTHACDLYEKACVADNLSGCAHFADCLRDGLGGREVQPARSCEFAQRACDGGEMYGCVGEGLCERSNLGVKYGEDACTLFRRSCDAGDQVGCAWLGVCHTEHSAGVEYSEAAACELFKKSCDAGGALSCAHLGICYRDGVGGLPKEDAKACDLFEQGCDDSGFAENDGCTAWARCLRDGPSGYQKSSARADQIDERVCTDGVARACSTLAAAFDEGTAGRVKDPVRACQFHALACAGGFNCLKASHCQCQGAVSGAPNPTAAHEALAKACKAGDKQACDEDKTPGCGVPGAVPGLVAAGGVPPPALGAQHAAGGRLSRGLAAKNLHGVRPAPGGTNRSMSPAMLAALKANGGRLPTGAMQRPMPAVGGGRPGQMTPASLEAARKASGAREKVYKEIQ